MSRLAEEINRLRQVLDDPSDPHVVRRADEVLAQIDRLDDANCIDAILGLLSDAQPDQLVFSMVHLIERFSDDEYVARYLNGVPQLIQRSKRWAGILLLRILNNSKSMDSLARLSAASSVEIRAVLRALLEELRQTRPQFTRRCDALVLSLQ